ncbi:MAG TPA: flagellar type III secretion system protein FlhB [Methylothermaceae bacterium]|nr:flagellar type III secretion system protein FlhB [Methylothermaceae bacterium]
MAEEDSGQERTEEPTPKRLEEARKKGQIPRSRELNTFAVVMAGVAGCGILGRHMAESLERIMRANFRVDREDVFQSQAILERSLATLLDGLLLLAPFLVLMVVVAFVAPILLGGWALSWEALQPKFSKLNPLEGFKRMFALRGLVELVKSLLKVVMLAGVAALVFQVFGDAVFQLVREDLQLALARGLDFLWQASLFLGSALLVVVAIDVPYQLWDHHRKLKMTLQEVKDEFKESEGRPEVKSKIRQLQRERAQQRMMEEVPKADVVITNPTHFAVALRYDQSRGGAPRVVAKGTDLMAARIREIAVEAGVPLVAAPPLARALYYSTELEQEIPEGLYLAVAQVLAYVYQLQAATGVGEQPVPPTDLPIPEEYARETPS